MILQREPLKIAKSKTYVEKGNSKYLHLKIQQNRKPELSTLYHLSH